MKRNILLALGALGIAASTPCWASQQTGTVQSYAIGTSASSAVIVSGSRTAMPACATDSSWAVDGSTSNGAQLMAAIMTAKTTGRSVVVVGTGACDPNFPRETVAYIQFN